MQNVPLRSIADYRNATDSLNQSTAALELQAQATQTALNTISNRQAKTRDVTTSHSNLEQQQISTLIETLKRELDAEYTQSSEKLRKKISSSLISIADTLRRDDHVLSQLEFQLYSNSDDTSEIVDAERLEVLLGALRHTRSEAIKTRLNRVYLETVTSSVAHQNGLTFKYEDDTSNYDSYDFKRDYGREAEDVKADLRSLYAEIDDVAQLRVNHEHGDQISATIEQLDHLRRHLSKLHTLRALRQLKTMTNQLDQIATHCESLQSRRIAQHRLQAHFESIVKTDQPRHQVLNTPSRTGDGRADGPAIAALRQYLNLSGDGSDSTKQDEQAKQAFDEYAAHVQTSVELSNQQARFLDRTGGDAAGNVSSDTNCKSKLADLDARIARLKVQMEVLTG